MSEDKLFQLLADEGEQVIHEIYEDAMMYFEDNLIEAVRVPKAYSWCFDALHYIGEKIYREGAHLYEFRSVWKELHQLSEEFIADLCHAERWLINSTFYSKEGSVLDDEELGNYLIDMFESYLSMSAQNGDDKIKDEKKDEQPLIVTAKPSICPICGHKPVPILYGQPFKEHIEASERGELILGGCFITGKDPEWGCPHCRQSFIEKW